MKSALTIFMLSFSIFAHAQQGLKETGRNPLEIVPSGWTETHALGDLNKDGVNDMVIIAIPDDKEHVIVRESDGYQFNLNQPILAIYFGKSNGTFSFNLWKKYDNVLPAPPDEFVSITNTLGITDQGVLTINVETFASMGGWGTGSTTYLFRYQNNDFYLIGKDENYMMRNSGEVTIDSYNYLTYRHQKITFNEFDKNVKRKEKWNRLPKAQLRRLGSFELDE